MSKNNVISISNTKTIIISTLVWIIVYIMEKDLSFYFYILLTNNKLNKVTFFR